MGYEDHMKHAVRKVSCAVITVSDTRTPENDTSGQIIIKGLESQGHEVREYHIVPDSVVAIRAAISRLLEDDSIKVVITNGGTGIARRDLTVEAVEPLLEKKMDGFGEIFRLLSYQEIGPAAVLSRAIAGTSSQKIIICLPGSSGAVRLAMDKIILPQIGHMVLEAEK